MGKTSTVAAWGLAVAISVATLRADAATAGHSLTPRPGATGSAPAATLGGAAISVDKTVGTDSSVCAVTDVVNLPPGGGQVTYCYEVTNTGSITLTRHDLVDSELGVLLSDFPFTLAPGAAAFLTQNATINITTINTADWTAYNPGPVDVAVASDTATVNVAAAAPSISLAKTVGLDPHVCAATTVLDLPVGAEVTYCYEVTNTGNITLDLHDLVDSELGIILNDFPYALAPGAAAFLTQSATIDVTTVNTADWTATDALGANAAASSTSATVNIGQGPSTLEIPTASTLGLLALATLLCLVAVQRLRRSFGA